LEKIERWRKVATEEGTEVEKMERHLAASHDM
jgi:hypothetical protein